MIIYAIAYPQHKQLTRQPLGLLATHQPLGGGGHFESPYSSENYTSDQKREKGNR